MACDNTLTFTDDSFDAEVLNSDVPVLVDFWAEWCGPCRMMTPTVDAIANDYLGRVKVGKVNVDENGGIAMRYSIRGIPSLLLFKGGQPVAQKVGAVGKSDLQKMIDAHLSAPAAAPAPTPAVSATAVPQNGRPAVSEQKETTPVVTN